MKNIFYILCIIALVSCKKEVKTKSNATTKVENTIEYANGFKIIPFNGFKKLVLQSPLSDVKEEYLIVTKGQKVPENNNLKVIKTPIKRIVVTSTTHIPMIELLHEENSIVGFPNTKYVSSIRTRALIDAKKIQELGKEQAINTEMLIELNPELVVGFTLGGEDKMFQAVTKFGIEVIYNGDWLENTPLGRAEWIKFFGLLFDKEEKADTIFKKIETEYNSAKKLALTIKNKPTVLSGVMTKDQWHLPAGESYVTQFLKDANVNYPWINTKGTGSLNLSFEHVLDKAQHATIWLSPGYKESFEQLEKANTHYQQFDAFKNKQVYNFTSKKGATGGVIYYEKAITEPQIILKDIIKVAHPELLPNYSPFYLSVLK